ncbi:M48 family metallopeptidase [Clostridium carnis]
MINKILIKDKALDIQISYKNKKSLSMRVDENGKILISSPIFLKENDILKIIRKKENWIIERLDEINNLNYFKYENGSKILYLGKEYDFKVRFDNTLNEFKVLLENDKVNLIINKYQEKDVKLIVDKWLKKKAVEILGSRTIDICNKIDIFPSRIIIKNQKSRWGSCNYKKEIRLNYNLIKAPIEVIDYVIIHELCHIKHMNHSKEYWDLVKIYMPSYKEKNKWLKENGSKILSNN